MTLQSPSVMSDQSRNIIRQLQVKNQDLNNEVGALQSEVRALRIGQGIDGGGSNTTDEGTSKKNKSSPPGGGYGGGRCEAANRAWAEWGGGGSHQVQPSSSVISLF